MFTLLFITHIDNSAFSICLLKGITDLFAEEHPASDAVLSVF
ncbi:hypothetical protein RV10_GL000587 [Enterococcus pallens]|nr:hypothetical protein RV10_GL000587 [Enterococcus pallens]